MAKKDMIAPKIRNNCKSTIKLSNFQTFSQYSNSSSKFALPKIDANNIFASFFVLGVYILVHGVFAVLLPKFIVITFLVMGQYIYRWSFYFYEQNILYKSGVNYKRHGMEIIANWLTFYQNDIMTSSRYNFFMNFTIFSL